MKRTTSNSQGFAAAEAILIIVILAVIGFVGWYVWHSKQTTHISSNAATTVDNSTKGTSPTGPTSKHSTSTDTAQTYLVVKEWGVEMQQQQALGTASYTYVDTTASPDSIKLDSDLEAQIPQACGGAHAGEFEIVRASQPDQDSDPSFTRQVGSYYYRFVYPQIGCDADTAGVISRLNTGYKAMFDSLQRAE